MRTQLRWLLGVCAVCCALCVTGVAEDRPTITYPPMRQPWKPAVSAIRQWLICGQFPMSADGNYEMDLLTDQGGEAAIAPKAGMAHKGPDGAEYRWVTYEMSGEVVDIAAALKQQPRDNSISYAYATIHSDEDRRALLTLGSDDGVIVYVNGKRIFSHILNRAAVLDDDAVEIDLKKGENRLLFKIQNTSGGVGVCARLADLGTLGLRPANVDLTPSADGKSLKIAVDTPVLLQVPSLAAVQVDMVAAGGKIIASKSMRRGETMMLDVSTLAEGAYEVACAGQTPEGKSFVTYSPWYKGDLLQAARRLAKATDANDPVTPMLAEMVTDRFAGKLDTATKVPDRMVASVHSAVMEAQELGMGAGGQIRPSGFIRLAYVDEVDNSVQFCRAYLPRHYDPAKKWPMVVSLHGYNPPNPRYVAMVSTQLFQISTYR